MPTPSEKVSRFLGENLSNTRINEVSIASDLVHEPYDVQARFVNIVLAYIYIMSYSGSDVAVRMDLIELARLCRNIKELAIDYLITPEPFEATGNTEYTIML